MPSRKQRRRRQKERRHDWEYVYVDDEGHEVEVDEPEAEPEQGRKSGATRAGSGRSSARATRRVDPPSLSRVGKRALFFAPVMFILINLVGHKLSVQARVAQTVLLLAVFLPFSYFMDALMYRTYLKRTGGAPPASRRRGSNGRA